MCIALDGAGTNKQHVITKNTAKLDRETEELKHDKIPLEVGKIIQEGRKAKGLKQSELAAVRIFTLRRYCCCCRCSCRYFYLNHHFRIILPLWRLS